MATPPQVLLEARGLEKHFPVTKGFLFMKPVGHVRAVDGLDFTIPRGRTFGLVGESGCGKTTTGKLVLRVQEPTGGTILFEGRDIATLSKEENRRFRASVQAVYQDPFSSLSPRLRVADIIGEPLVVNEHLSTGELRSRVEQLMGIVGLPADGARLYPHEFSGGQRQRIAIARALSLNPKLIVLDEPVSALDVSIRAQVLNLLEEIQEQFGPAYLLIAHDLAVVHHMSHTVGVMYLGKLVEVAESDEIHFNPLHPYTKALLSAVLHSDPFHPGGDILVTGEVPSPLNPPAGCRFHTRCAHAEAACGNEEPSLREVAPGHRVACHRV